MKRLAAFLIVCASVLAMAGADCGSTYYVARAVAPDSLLVEPDPECAAGCVDLPPGQILKCLKACAEE